MPHDSEIICPGKFVYGGPALGHTDDGSPVFVWGALPGETVLARFNKRRRGIYEAVAEYVKVPSTERQTAIEDHYLSCSPWQIVSWNAEQEWKARIARETYRHIAGIEIASDCAILGDEAQACGGYRNKIEYSFVTQDDGKISFAFFERGSRRRRAINQCMLADPAINRAAEHILDWIKKQPFPRLSLKSLVVRSNRRGETIAGLFVTERVNVGSLPEYEQCRGFALYYSRREHPAASPDELLTQAGVLELSERIAGFPMTYGLFSFFQINPPIFELALHDIKSSIPVGSSVLDFYSGVGSIGLPCSSNANRCVLVECGFEATKYAERNISINRIVNTSAVCGLAESLLQQMTSEHILIVDPPRAGLHSKVIKRIMEVKPSRVIYLACDLATQARDVGLLLGAYSIVDTKLYNFFPRTPHIEGLCVLASHSV